MSCGLGVNIRGLRVRAIESDTLGGSPPKHATTRNDHSPCREVVVNSGTMQPSGSTQMASHTQRRKVSIDEASTPLIISKQVPAPKEKYDISAQLAGVLKKDKDYEVDIKGQLVTMTDDGFSTTEKLLGKPMFDPADPWAPFVMNAIKAAGGPLVEKRNVQISAPIKKTGSHTVAIDLHPDVVALVTIEVVPS